MKILFIGDVVGATGCRAVVDYVPKLRELFSLDFVIANAENAAFHGITKAIVDSFYAAGVDGITSGNHMWDQREIYDFIDQDPRLVRPINLKQARPGNGYTIINVNGYRLLLVNALGSVHMKDPVTSPFEDVMRVVEKYPLKKEIDAILVDFHAEITAEKNAMGTCLDGKVSIVVGTHTHMPTADHQILPLGTAYQTDAGMTCDYDSIIGINKNIALEGFLGKRERGHGYICADGDATLCGLIVDVDNQTGLARAIEPVRVGGRLSQTHAL